MQEEALCHAPSEASWQDGSPAMPPDSGSTWKGGKGEAGDPGMAQLPGPEGHRSPLPSPGQTRRQRGRPRLTRKFPCRLGPGGPSSLLTESGSAVGVLPGPPLWCAWSVLSAFRSQPCSRWRPLLAFSGPGRLQCCGVCVHAYTWEGDSGLAARCCGRGDRELRVPCAAGRQLSRRGPLPGPACAPCPPALRAPLIP